MPFQQVRISAQQNSALLSFKDNYKIPSFVPRANFLMLQPLKNPGTILSGQSQRETACKLEFLTLPPYQSQIIAAKDVLEG